MADDAMAGVYANLALRLADVAAAGVDSLSTMAPRTAEIIAVGSELLGSTRTDTNSLYHLRAGSPRSASSCGSRASSATSATISRAVFRQALDRTDLVVLTGGLGPTDDDLTRDVVSEVLACR